MRSIIFLIVIALIIKESKATNPPIPQTFGIMTMTYSRGGDNTMFEGYLKHYAEMDCPIITEINIVWNNEKTPKQMGLFKNSQNWKRPINFYLTPYNSLNWRYKIPQESKQKIFFYVDDDIVVECQEMIKGFKIWQANAIGQIGPIVSYHIRQFQYTNGQTLKYGASPQLFYAIGLLSAGFVSSHFMELYYADIWELQEVRKIVTDKNNCEDIALDFIISYFYPQFLTKFVEGKTQGLQVKVGVSKSGNHMQTRGECITQFTYIFGFNTFRLQPIHDKFPNAKKWRLPFRNETVLAKKEYFERDVLHKKGMQQKIESNQLLTTSKLTPIPEYVLLFAVFVLLSILVMIAIWRVKENISRKQNSSRVLTIQMDQSTPETARSSMRNENNTQ